MNLRLYLACLSLGGSLTASAASDRDALKFFETEVRPLLAETCFDCHSAEKQKGNLRLDHLSWILKGGDAGPAIVPHRPDESLLIEAIRREDPDFEMPPKKALTSEQVAVLEKWVSEGAYWPDDPQAEVAEATDQHGFTAEDREWWAIQPVQDPDVPEGGDGWARNEIDRFVARRLADAKLEPAVEADRAELVRRAYFDLHGLPPTPEQVAAFINDERTDAFERLIDELLASPRYGERWAQHWLDVVRFAESDGYRADGYRSGTWKYRDYVIRSLNEDKPYDEFVRDQLAADEFAPHDPDRLIATAFLRLGIYEWNQRNARMQWDIIMTEMTNVTAEAFLGIGIGCAQCHDHKFDPILQKDHFALQAFLNTTWWPENSPLAGAEEKAEYDRQNEKWEAATAEIRKEIKALQQNKLDGSLSFTVKQFPEDIQKIYYKPSNERTAYEEQLAQLVQRQVDHNWNRIKWESEFKKKEDRLEQYEKLKAELAKFDHLKPKEFPNGFIATDIKPEPAKTYLAKRSGKEEVEPAFLTLLGQPAPKIEPTDTTTGRRKALADWIASPNNPLSTRVIVNRIWQRHFGTGIVPTPNDFGTLGEEPSHPELLDWLTSRFLDQGWRFKELHRTIMTSATYRQTARHEPTKEESLVDPTNRLLWRFPPRRLDAEQVRDAMLTISGELKNREGGAGTDGNSPVRSIYVKKMRNSPDKVLNGFDAPMGFGSTPNRSQTTTPTQSLLLVNGAWTMKRAQAFAKRVLNGSNTPGEAEVRKVFRSVYGREASNEELQLGVSFLKSQIGEVGTKPVAPPAKYPGETGQRPIRQVFSNLGDDLELGSKALWIQPGSRFERLHLAKTQLQSDTFTVETIANLDRIYDDASVNTLVSRWNGSHSSSGWSLGVTSAKSKYQPRNLILQLIGKNVAGGMDYEVVASGLRFPLNKPVYVAAAITAQDMGNVGGTVTFYMKDLSDPNAEMQIREVPHSIAEQIQTPSSPILVGGRNTGGHLWDGQVARLAFSSSLLPPDALLFQGSVEDRFADFDFSTPNGEQPAPGALWFRSPSAPSRSGNLSPAVLGAMTDFCHALLNSNEFLYLH